MKCYDLESNGNEIILSASRHSFICVFENLSTLKTLSYTIHRLTAVACSVD